jgi:glycolate oxidase
MPDAVVPYDGEQVQAIARLCRRDRVPIVPRGSGTGLIGGAMAPHGGVMVSMTRMTAILDVDPPNAARSCSRG